MLHELNIRLIKTLMKMKMCSAKHSVKPADLGWMQVGDWKCARWCMSASCAQSCQNKSRAGSEGPRTKLKPSHRQNKAQQSNMRSLQQIDTARNQQLPSSADGDQSGAKTNPCGNNQPLVICAVSYVSYYRSEKQTEPQWSAQSEECAALTGRDSLQPWRTQTVLRIMTFTSTQMEECVPLRELGRAGLCQGHSVCPLGAINSCFALDSSFRIVRVEAWSVFQHKV